ncbi:MAG: hypothetical protein ACXVMS_16205 [Flavisolibacter sp.]
MNEQIFLHNLNSKARQLNINPLLLLSGIEGLYTFKDVQLNKINYEFLDSLILTIFALRIGDQFHTIAQENLLSSNADVRTAASHELAEMNADTIASSSNPYLQSFAGILNGKSSIRKYHEKALEVAALEIRKTQLNFQSQSISTIVLALCQNELKDSLHLSHMFNS